MSRALACLIALGLFGHPGRADEKGTNPETLIRLDVTPEPAPEPRSDTSSCPSSRR